MHCEAMRPCAAVGHALDCCTLQATTSTVSLTDMAATVSQRNVGVELGEGGMGPIRGMAELQHRSRQAATVAVARPPLQHILNSPTKPSAYLQLVPRRLRACTCVRVCIPCVCVCVCACVCACVRMDACLRACVHACGRLSCVRACTRACACACLRACVRCVRACVRSCVHACVHACVRGVHIVCLVQSRWWY
jgi:hypothetical protein